MSRYEKILRVLNYGFFGDKCASSIKSSCGKTPINIKNLLEKGCPTDDTEMTLAVKECIEAQTFSSSDFLKAFKKYCKNRGTYNKKTLQVIDEEFDIPDQQTLDTNGAIMRSSPFLLVEKSERRMKLENNLMFTHWNTHCINVSLDYIQYLDDLLTKGKFLIQKVSDLDLMFRIFFCNNNIGNGKDNISCFFAPFGLSVQNCDTFAYAYWFFINHTEETYEKGLETILSRGNANTVSKLYCEMVGCVSSCFDKYL